MANRKRNQSEDSPQWPARLDSSSTPKKRADANRAHHQGLVEGTLDSAIYNQHGHFVGRQGKAGHDMPQNDADRQGGQYIPRAVHQAAVAAGPNEFGDNGSADANPSGSDDYGKVDKGS